MLSEREVAAAIGSTAYGDGGDKLGTVEHFFVDDRTGEPTWVAVTTGLFGTRHSVVPARQATWDDGALRLPVSAEAVKNAPAMKGNHLEPADEAELRRHYGVDTGLATGTDAGRHRDTAAGPDAAPPRADVPLAGPTDTVAVPAVAPGPPSAAAGTDGAMTRSEERLRVDTERVATRRVRLVKYVVTEEVQITVPIRREEFRIEELPLDAAGTATDTVTGESLVPEGSASGGLPGEIILHTERPVIGVEVVPSERVRLRTELVEGQETVTEQVQREQVVVDQDGVTGAGDRDVRPRP
jgi:stress response protein YsnF